MKTTVFPGNRYKICLQKYFSISSYLHICWFHKMCIPTGRSEVNAYLWLCYRNTNCSWFLTAKDPNDTIVVEFDHMDVQSSSGCVADSVTVYNDHQGDGKNNGVQVPDLPMNIWLTAIEKYPDWKTWSYTRLKYVTMAFPFNICLFVLFVNTSCRDLSAENLVRNISLMFKWCSACSEPAPAATIRSGIVPTNECSTIDRSEYTR